MFREDVKVARKSTKITKSVKVEDEPQSNGSLFDYLRFGESYTSLILGIIVVIISTVLLLSFVNNKNAAKQDTPQLLSQKDIALPSTPITTNTPPVEKVETTTTPVPTKVPTITKAVTTPTAVPTKKVAPTKKVEPTKTVAKATPTKAPVKVAQGSVNPASGEYTVAVGDNLWSIAEKQYKSGYNWVDIARANNLSNPNVISKGQKLKMPKVEQKIATVGVPQNKVTTPNQPVVQANSVKITGNTYTTVKGDNLWNIAVRAYGDGYQWQKIASANNLSNPRIIHSGNKIKIPRG